MGSESERKREEETENSELELIPNPHVQFEMYCTLKCNLSKAVDV